MAAETMTSDERILAAFALEKPDRVPIAPEMWYGADATLVGHDPLRLALASQEEMLDVQLEVFDEYGGWDGIHLLPVGGDFFTFLGMKLSPPTKESPIWQVLEQENMTYDDYDIVAEIGWVQYVKDVLAPRIAGWDDAKHDGALALDQKMYERAEVEYGKRGARIMLRTWDAHPFFRFSLARSMLKFTEDLYFRPEKVRKALQRCTEEYIENGLAQQKQYGKGVYNCTEERGGGFFYPASIFEEFWWPYTVQMIDALWSAGITIQFHLDTPWDKNVSYFKQLPKGSFGFHLDSTTDIFAAKEQIRGKGWIIGDVSAALFSLGSPQEMEAYVKRLIDEVGDDGGFILGSGCNVPNMVKPENFKAYIETGRNYRGK